MGGIYGRPCPLDRGGLMLEIVYDATLTILPSYSWPTGGDPLLKCGNGHIASLSEPDHIIDAAGIVTPSLVCPSENDCGWHENVRLLDWPPSRPVKPEPPGVGGPV